MKSPRLWPQQVIFISVITVKESFNITKILNVVDLSVHIWTQREWPGAMSRPCNRMIITTVHVVILIAWATCSYVSLMIVCTKFKPSLSVIGNLTSESRLEVLVNVMSGTILFRSISIRRLPRIRSGPAT